MEAKDINNNNLHNNDEMNNQPDAKYKVGQIVITSFKGDLKKRHIYMEPNWVKLNDGTDRYGWVYPVDYGLGLQSEGFLAEKNIIRIANDTDNLIAL